MLPEPASGDSFTLARKRVHEAEGWGRRAFALFQAARHPGPLVWILPAHAPEMPMFRGLPCGVGERLYLLRPAGETNLCGASRKPCGRLRSAWSLPSHQARSP